ncbi:MAG: elongation factor G [Spirochaetales bacterium]|nr:elongation factor G [Spirochaetales bacterium]MCF7938416.1 elongation factor G [Spirochaetales bacterium]
MARSTESIRNTSFVGHGSTGKTTMVERLLALGGKISKPESVDSGKTVSDYTEEEIERKISIHTSLSHIEWKDTKINLLDTPGASDFIGEVVSANRSADSAVMMVAGESGVQIETIKLWRRLNERNMPRAVFINKMDKDRADFESALNDLNENFDQSFVAVTVPVGSSESFSDVVDTIKKQAEQGDIPSDMSDDLASRFESIVEAAAEGDDALMEKYFEDGELSPDEIRQGLIAGLRNNKIVPVFCGSTESGIGVQTFLDYIVELFPSPVGSEEPVVNEDESTSTIALSSEGDVSALVFKTSNDQFSGRLSFVKVITGELHADSELYNLREHRKERISKIYTTLGKKLVEVKSIPAGDIGVLTKLDSVKTNDTLNSSDGNTVFLPLMLPHPVYSVAISAATKKEEDKMNQLLTRFTDEDLTFQMHFNSETKETVISGMGELHLNMILDRVKELGNVEVLTRTPKVAYRETISKKADAEYTHKKQSGGHGQFGRVVLHIEPLERGKQFEFENAIRGGSISKGYIPGVEKGVLEAMEAGTVAGYPVVDVKSVVVDGKEHPVDSSEMAFKIAARGAFRDAMQKAGPSLLEPYMSLSVFVDDQYLGDVLSDLSSRRGRVQGQNPVGGGVLEIKAQVPQSEMLRYAIDLRSITSGTGSFELEFSHYEHVAGNIAEAIVKAAEAEKEESD